MIRLMAVTMFLGVITACNGGGGSGGSGGSGAAGSGPQSKTDISQFSNLEGSWTRGCVDSQTETFTIKGSEVQSQVTVYSNSLCSGNYIYATKMVLEIVGGGKGNTDIQLIDLKTNARSIFIADRATLDLINKERLCGRGSWTIGNNDATSFKCDDISDPGSTMYTQYRIENDQLYWAAAADENEGKTADHRMSDLDRGTYTKSN